MTRFSLAQTLFAGGVFAASTLLAPTTRATTIYNAADDFSASSNVSSDIWTYGHDTGTIAGAPNQSTFTLFGAEEPGSAIAPLYTGLDVWYTGSAIDPNVIHNSSASTIADSSNTWLPNELTLGPFNGPTVVRFTAPATGLYDIVGAFSPSQTVNGIPDGYVFVNGGQVFDKPADGTPASIYTNSLTPLTIGDTVDFVVWGSNVNNKTTRLDATVTLIPEPASLGLLGLGAVSLLARRRRA